MWFLLLLGVANASSGCMDDTACNYDPTATTDDGLCLNGEYAVAKTSGRCNDDGFRHMTEQECQDWASVSYNIEVGNWLNTVAGGCRVPSAVAPNPPEYNTYTESTRSCSGDSNLLKCVCIRLSQCKNGCTDPTAFNYDESANTDNGSCVAVVNGCTDSAASNYDATANTDDGSCDEVLGCNNPDACNYDSTATTDDGTCLEGEIFVTKTSGSCTDSGFDHLTEEECVTFSKTATNGLGFVQARSYGVYVTQYTNSPRKCIWYPGGTAGTRLMYNTYWSSPSTLVEPGCEERPCACKKLSECSMVGVGCTDPTALNYDDSANTDDGSCVAVVTGCTDSAAFNYDASANTDDGSCVAVVTGCTDSAAFNYDASANVNNGSCRDVCGIAGGTNACLVINGGTLISATNETGLMLAYSALKC